MAEFSIDSAMKASHWELAKGHLRALASISGQYFNGDDSWKEVRERVEAFIKEFEDDGLDE